MFVVQSQILFTIKHLNFSVVLAATKSGFLTRCWDVSSRVSDDRTNHLIYETSVQNSVCGEMFPAVFRDDDR